MTYDKAYFIAKFEAIPEEQWAEGDYEVSNKRCALGHCGAPTTTAEADALVRLFKPGFEGGKYSYYSTTPVPDINDGTNKHYPQPTPKQRILAALNDLP